MRVPSAFGLGTSRVHGGGFFDEASSVSLVRVFFELASSRNVSHLDGPTLLPHSSVWAASVALEMRSLTRHWY